MIRLSILGELAFDSGDGTPPPALLGQPKRLALLAYLAVKGGALTPRDKVLALFWPEQPEERARHALNQALHVLRRELGPDAIVTLGHGLGVDPELVRCDAAEFEAALRSGDRGRAVELYRGPMLDGFYLSGTPEFDRWLDETRTDFHTRAAHAAARLADEAGAQGAESAVVWARRAAELAPYEGSAVQRVIAVLDGRGDSGGAVIAFEAFAQRLRADCELEPPAELAAMVAGIRARRAANPPPEIPARPPSTAPVLNASGSAPGAPTRRRARRQLVRGAAVLVAVAGAAAFGAWELRGSSPVFRSTGISSPDAVEQVAVIPFAADGDASPTRALGAEIAQLLATRLDSAGPVRAVPADVVSAASQRSGSIPPTPSSTVEGSATVSGDRVALYATWRRTVDHVLIGESRAEGPVGALHQLADTLALALLAQSQRGPAHDLARTATLTGHSLAAVKSFLQGENEFARGRFTAASAAFERATIVDSTFGLAQYRLGVAALWAEDYPLAAADAGARALRWSTGLSEHYRRLIAGFDAWRRGDVSRATEVYRGLLAADSNNVEAWFQFGETGFHYGPMLGHPVEATRAAFERVLQLDPNHWAARWHLALLDALEGRRDALDRGLDHLLSINPRTDYQLEIALLRACAHRDHSAIAQLDPALLAIADGPVQDLAWLCAVYGGDLDGAAAIVAAERARTDELGAVEAGRFVRAEVEMARGRRASALAQLDSVEWYSGKALGLRTMFALAPLVPSSSDELEHLARQWRTWSEPSPNPQQRAESKLWRAISLGRLEAALGHDDAAEQIAAELDRTTDRPECPGQNHLFADDIRAEMASHRGARISGSDPERIAPRLGVAPVWFGLLVTTALDSRPSWRFAMAEAFDRAGRPQEALRWYRSLDELSISDLVYAAPAHLRRGQILERLGDRAAASAEYRRFVELWSDADADFQPLVRQTRDRIMALASLR